MGGLDNAKLFQNLLALVGKSVEVGIASTGERLEGTITNTMFDSFLLANGNGQHVIRFDDILYLDECQTTSS